MLNHFRQLFESLRFAWQALRSNLLRTTLSLLGVTIGIFAIIGVLTIVDSLERNIKNSLSGIGSEVIYVQKWPWGFGEGEYAWWRYFQWPETSYKDYQFLNDRLQGAKSIVCMDFSRSSAKNGNNSIDVLLQGATLNYNQISEVKIVSGRYFTPQEDAAGRGVAIIGAEIAETLFPNDPEPIGKVFKVGGYKLSVIGVFEKQGKSLIDVGGNPDTKVLMPYLFFAKGFQNRVFNSVDICIKGYPEDKGLAELSAEITGILRAKRGLKPWQESNFSLNKPEAAMKAVGQIFGVLTTAGWVIGFFALLVGGFGIANIMFVSVKERTSQIGIQKSLGAKNYSILYQFLFEALFLSVIGSLVGLGLVYLLSFMSLGSLDIVLTPANITLGLVVAGSIGVLAGIIPALLAARMDPVEAIRAK